MFRLPSNSKELSDRLRLIKAENIYNIQVLREIFDKAKAEELSDRDIEKIVQEFRSEEFGFDEIYKIKLAICDWLLTIDNRSDQFLLFIDPESRQWQRMAEVADFPEGYGSEEYLERRRASLKSQGESMLKYTSKEVKARLALLEVFTRIIPNTLIPDLLEICPKYLGCPLIQKWIMSNQFYSLHGDENKVEEGTKNLKRLNKVLLPDKRKKKRQNIEYWSLDRYYSGLTNHVVGSRIAKSEGRLDPEFMKIFFDYWEIPSEYHGHFESDEVGPKEIALSIMVSKGMIKSESSFREFQPKINKLKKKHEGVEYMDVLAGFLDLSVYRSDLIANPKLWDLLN